MLAFLFAFLFVSSVTSVRMMAENASASANSLEEGCMIFLGAYSKSINAFTFSERTGKLELVNSTSDASVDNPSWLVLSNSGKFLYSVNEVDNYEGAYSGYVAAYSIDTATSKLTLLNQVSTQGAVPAHGAISADDATLYVSNYCSGSIAVMSVLPSGHLGEVKQLINHNSFVATDCGGESGVAHAHEVVLDEISGVVFNPDKGLDRVYQYLRSRSGDGTLVPPTHITAPNLAVSVPSAPQAGPRHLLLHPTLPFAFVINELDSTLSTFSYNNATVAACSNTSATPEVHSTHCGLVPTAHVVSCLPPDVSPDGWGAAELALSRDGRFLYASNRDISEPNQHRSSIAVFSVCPHSGALQAVQHVSSMGDHPRHFALSPSGRWILVANRDSNSVAVMPLDAETGRIDAAASQVFTSDEFMVAPAQLLLVPK